MQPVVYNLVLWKLIVYCSTISQDVSAKQSMSSNDGEQLVFCGSSQQPSCTSWTPAQLSQGPNGPHDELRSRTPCA